MMRQHAGIFQILLGGGGGQKILTPIQISLILVIPNPIYITM